MSSTFSRSFPERYRLSNSELRYSASPPAGHRDNNNHQHRIPAQLHTEPLRRSLPLLLYPSRLEPRLYDSGSYRSSPSSLLPFLGPFHGRFGVYECPFEPAFIQKRNERERQRVKCVNQGYAKLRDHLPGGAAEKRMSKVETLRAAIRYIKYLQRLVEGRERTDEGAECAKRLDDAKTTPPLSTSPALTLNREELQEARPPSRDAA